MAKVYVLAGHGGYENGAAAYGLIEDEITLVMAKACQKELERHGVEVIMGRTEDVYLTFEQEVAPANENNVDIALFLHVNATPSGDGAEAWIYPGSVNGRKMAELCLKQVEKLGQNIDRGVKEGSFYVLQHTNMPAVLLEAFFIDNDKDNDIGDTKAEQEKFGVAYAKAVLEYLGIAWTEPKAADVLYKVQVGAFSIRKNAESLKRTLEALGYEPFIVEVKR